MPNRLSTLEKPPSSHRHKTNIDLAPKSTHGYTCLTTQPWRGSLTH